MQHGNQIGASENLKAANTYHKAKPEPVFQEWCSDLVSTICSLFTFSSQKTLLNRTKPPPICLFFAMLCYCERLGVVPEIPLSALWLLLYLFFLNQVSRLVCVYLSMFSVDLSIERIKSSYKVLSDGPYPKLACRSIRSNEYQNKK